MVTEVRPANQNHTGLNVMPAYTLARMIVPMNNAFFGITLMRLSDRGIINHRFTEPRKNP